MKTNLTCLIFLAIQFLSNCFAQDSLLRLNDIRILASHNSYKKLPNSKVIRFLSRFKKQLGSENDPIQLDYGHLPIQDQLNDYNIRGLELDIYHDPKGKLFRNRKINRFIIGEKVRNKDPKLKQPGFKILHIPDIDFETNYLTLIDALVDIKNWSDQHKSHIPIFINIEAKGSSAADQSLFLRLLGFKRAVRFDSLAYELLDQEIRSVFQPSQLFTPQDMKINYSSIQERLNTIGWPLLESCLGKIVFILQGNNDFIYKSSIDRNEERVMFVYAEPEEKNTAFVVRNTSKGIENQIRELSSRYIIRSRTDAGTIQARNNDYSDFESVMKSDAQIISTDYYKFDSRFGAFQIKLNGMTREMPYILRD